MGVTRYPWETSVPAVPVEDVVRALQRDLTFPWGLTLNQQRYRADPEAGRIRTAKYRAKNPEKIRAYAIKQYDKNRARHLIAAASSRAKKLNVPFDLKDHVSHYQAVIDAGFCEVTGAQFIMERGSPFAPSLDRIKPKLGYVHGNVRVVLFAVNVGIFQWGEETYRMVAETYLHKQLQPVTDLVKHIQNDFSYALQMTGIRVHSDHAALQMLVNTPRGEIIPRGECWFTDGTKFELQDIGMPQVGAPEMTVQRLIAEIWDTAAIRLGLELRK